MPPVDVHKDMPLMQIVTHEDGAQGPGRRETEDLVNTPFKILYGKFPYLSVSD